MTNQTTTTTPAVRGRPFPKGNGGRRLGSKNRSSLIFAALSDDDKEDVVRKGLELAKAGDVSMLKFFLGRSCRGNGQFGSICRKWSSVGRTTVRSIAQGMKSRGGGPRE